MATLFEYLNTGDDSASYISSGAIRKAQTFTPAISHTITSVKLKLYRLAGTPGDIYIAIKATDGSGHPTGIDLAIGTTNGNTLTTISPGEWREITLGAGVALTAGIKYAIVVYADSSAGVNVAYWRWVDDGFEHYVGGNPEYYNGFVWSVDEAGTPRDYMFEDWGIGVGAGFLYSQAHIIN